MRRLLPTPALCLAWLTACATADTAPDGGVSAADAAGNTDAPAQAPAPDAATAPDAPVGAPDAAPIPDAAAPPAPDAPPCTDTWIDLLNDGAFDQSSSAWSETAPIVSEEGNELPIDAHSPTFAAWVLGTNNGDEELTQPVSVPADATALRLRGYRCFVTSDTTGTDTMDIVLRATGGGVLETLASFSNADVDDVCSWTFFQHPAASAHAGQSVTLVFHGVSDGSYPTSFFVDTLALEALVCQ